MKTKSEIVSTLTEKNRILEKDNREMGELLKETLDHVSIFNPIYDKIKTFLNK